jgi:lysozyme
VTTENLLPDLQRDEGLRLTAYPDPLSGGEPWTIGYGHTGDVVEGETCTEDQALDWLTTDVAFAEMGLDGHLPWWRTLDDPRQDVLCEMAFQLGVAGLCEFTHTLAAVQAGDWQAAHDGMLDSEWARQVPSRANRLATQMLTGVSA